MGAMEEVTEDTRCSYCGAPTEIQMGDFWICERCYEVRSSCCTEFEGDEDGSVAEELE